MSVLNPPFHGAVHFPVQLICAIAVLVAVAVLWIMGVPAIQNTETGAATNAQECASGDDECLQIWVRENLSNIQQPIGILGPEVFGGVDQPE